MWMSNLEKYLQTQEGQTQAMGYGGIALLTLSLLLLIYWLASKPSALLPTRGVRGLHRAHTLQTSSLFALIDPLVRYIAGRVAALPIDGMRNSIEPQLVQGGEYMGLTPDEYIALSTISAIIFAAIGGFASYMMFNTIEPMLMFMAGCLGAYLPHLQVQSAATARAKQLNRGLPFAIDLMALAMSAGLDFRGALRQVTDKAPDRKDALYEELMRIQQEMDLGHTRKQALEAFAHRCPTDSVKDFTAAVVQAEEKGNPLVEVLNVQANMLRMRRSIAAEEAAARAGVLLLGPLMMIFGCIMIILMGPFAVSSVLGKGGL
jgi:tight adherence protein C